MNKNDLIKSVGDMVLDFTDSEIEREKSKSAERRDGGKAFKAMRVADRIIDAVQTYADDMAFKAVGECKHCYGKGYSSVMSPAHIAKADFIGDKEQIVKPSWLEYRFCSCERGQALKHLILSNAPFVAD